MGSEKVGLIWQESGVGPQARSGFNGRSLGRATERTNRRRHRRPCPRRRDRVGL